MYKDIYTPEELKFKNKMWEILCKKFFQQFVKETDVVLDLGCGRCEFVNFIKAKEKYAIDTEEYKKYVSSDVNFIIEQMPYLNLKFTDNYFDIIFASNLFEHFKTKDEAKNILNECYRILKPDGKLLILQPNFKYAYREYYDTLDHYIVWTHLGFKELLECNGFKTETIIPQFLPYSVKQKLPKTTLFLEIYLKVPILWKIFGKQFFIAAVKEEK